ncbi:MAG: DNA-binding protein [Gammaproteobacteria bacterium]|nr:MAG: DNA-binding protein [Gammaproteobacteria bacterium]
MEPFNSTSPTWTSADVARFLQCTPATVARLAAEGILPAAKIGRRWVFRRQDIERYLDERIAEQRAAQPAWWQITPARTPLRPTSAEPLSTSNKTGRSRRRRGIEVPETFRRAVLGD